MKDKNIKNQQSFERSTKEAVWAWRVLCPKLFKQKKEESLKKLSESINEHKKKAQQSDVDETNTTLPEGEINQDSEIQVEQIEEPQVEEIEPQNNNQTLLKEEKKLIDHLIPNFLFVPKGLISP